MDKINSILVTIIGILLILPLIGVDALGTVESGIAGWIIALAVLIVGILSIIKSFKG